MHPLGRPVVPGRVLDGRQVVQTDVPGRIEGRRRAVGHGEPVMDEGLRRRAADDHPVIGDHGGAVFDAGQGRHALVIDDQNLHIAVFKGGAEFARRIADVDRHHDGAKPGQGDPGNQKGRDVGQPMTPTWVPLTTPKARSALAHRLAWTWKAP